MSAKIFRNWLYPASFFTILFTLFFFFITDVASDAPTQAMTLRTLSCLFGFGLSVAAANLFLHLNQISAVLRYALHTTACLLGFILFILLLSGYSKNNGLRSIVIALAFLVLYAIIMGLRALILYALREKETERQTYTPKFKK